MAQRIRFKKFVWVIIAAVIILPYTLPEPVTIPVLAASQKDWHPNSFWYEPWGSSGVHKGIDIFAQNNTPVLSTTYGLVLWRGNLTKGGKVVLALGPKWRLHYYAHLHSINYDSGHWLSVGSAIGSVGTSGNAANKPPHLHYSIVSLIPNPLSFSAETQGYKKGFFVDPSQLLAKAAD